MKQEIIYLKDFSPERDYFSGNVLGGEVFQKILKRVNSTPATSTFAISLKNIVGTDASFARESAVSIVKLFCGEKGFYLKDLDDQDLIDNWNYAAIAKDQNIIIYKKSGAYEVIGPKLPESAKQTLDFVMHEGTVTTSRAVNKFNVSPQTASARLKKIYDLGLVLASKETAESGGPEFIYRAIK